MVEGTSEDEVIEALRKSARKGSAFASGRKRQGAPIQEVGWYTYPRENVRRKPLGRDGHD